MSLRKRTLAAASGLAAATVFVAPLAWSQQTDRTSFPPGPGYAGVAGSAEENARITELCGPNRNADDGYFAQPLFPEQARAPLMTSIQPYHVEVVASFDRSIGIAFLPSGNILASQRAGGMRTISPEGVVSEPLAGVPDLVAGRLAAASDILLDKDFATNRTLYYGLITPLEDGGSTGRIIKARLSDDERSLEDVVTILDEPTMVPRRLVQLSDGTILIASAEVASGGPNPQSMENLRGKVLRIGADGSIPADNPFVSTPGANPAIYSLGFRDIQGFAIHPETGEPWVAENTPMGGDELNLIRSGGNYGFPVISYGRENGGAMINDGKTVQEGMEQPAYIWTPSVAPSGLAFYTGDGLPEWTGDIFMGGMSGEQVVRLRMEDGLVVGEEKLLMDRCQRIKDVRQGNDGLLYVLTDESPSELLRIAPGAGSTMAAATAVRASFSAEMLESGRAAYVRVCAVCHGAEGQGVRGPSLIGQASADDVAGVIAEGIGAMPSMTARLGAGEAEAVAAYVMEGLGH